MIVYQFHLSANITHLSEFGIGIVNGIQINFSFIWKHLYPDTEKGELQPLSPKLILLWLTIFCCDCQIDLSGIPPIIYSQSNPVSSCLVSWTPADKEFLCPHPLVAHKDKPCVSSGFRESAVSLSLSYISMVFLAFRFLFLVNGIFYVCILLSKSPLSGSI